MSKLIFRFKVTFEDVDDVERIIDVSSTNTFKEFHHFIQESIKFDNIKPASFYKANDSWRGGEEFSTTNKQNAKSAGASELGKFIDDPHQKFLYNYDPEAGNWHLRAEIIKLLKADENAKYPSLYRSIGIAPKQFVDPKKIITDPSAKLLQEADELIKSLTDDIEDEDLDKDSENENENDFNLFGDEVDESEIDESQINDGPPED